jgi:hypothetical protein
MGLPCAPRKEGADVRSGHGLGDGRAIAALAWVRFAEHPTARNVRAAIAGTLGL